MEKEIRLLEFDKIRNFLIKYCITPMAGQLAEDLVPIADLALCQRWQAETTEAVTLMKRHQVSIDNVPDARHAIALAARGAMLGEEQLAGILRLLLAVTKVKLFFKDKEGYPVLLGLINEMNSFQRLREDLKQAINEEGCLRDDATPELARLTRAINSGERDLRERFERFIKDPGKQKYLQESLITVRGERLVVPIRVEYRAQVPGVVHDQSASGATLFIEPLWAVEANNKLSVLRREAEREKERILLSLSQLVGTEAEGLNSTLTLYAEFDFILAKGKLSLSLKGVEPELNDHGRLKIIAGRHPLLGEGAVPISLEMGESLRTLVITGPNTGGKTVTLKTVGLFAMMAQSGLHVPAQEGTVLPVFPRIFADIGDEQDISQSLSTFSGHLKNIVGILEALENNSLVLLDEVGAGTDPTEGAALAMAILEYLHQSGAVTVATTHYSQLKSYAYLTEGMENASVEFDVKTLRPTYQLLVGVPGVSNAFAIAKRLGLPDEITARGKDFLSHEEKRLEEVVADLVADRKRWELMLAEAEDERREAHMLLTKVKQEQEALTNRKNEVINKAKKEALEIVVRAKRETQQLLKEVRKLAAQSPKEAVKQIEETERKLELHAEEVGTTLDVTTKRKTLKEEDLYIGMEVQVNSLSQRGVIVQIGQGQVQVQIGAMRINAAVEDLSPVVDEEKKIRPKVTTLYVRRDVPRELDLRGLTFEEAAMKVDTYLDEANIAALKEVCLIHGKGTGRLRAGLQEYLTKHFRVAAFRLGHPSEGGTGVTIVTLK
ncbi:MAG: endonuclease MutS2 [Firmicutes bacterium]|nr:endonuclease MutS2 [Bacillota bacterium]